jgi:hypothetical protein
MKRSEIQDAPAKTPGLPPGYQRDKYPSNSLRRSTRWPEMRSPLLRSNASNLGGELFVTAAVYRPVLYGRAGRVCP